MRASRQPRGGPAARDGGPLAHHRVPTGIATLDKNTLGFSRFPRRARRAPSVGKTPCAQTRTHAATRLKKVAFFSLRDALRAARAPHARLRRRSSTGGGSRPGSFLLRLAEIQTARRPDLPRSIWLADNFVLTPVELRSKCRK